MLQYILTGNCHCGSPNCGFPDNQRLVIITVIEPKNEADIKMSEEIVKMVEPLLSQPAAVVDGDQEDAMFLMDDVITSFKAIRDGGSKTDPIAKVMAGLLKGMNN